VGIVFGQNRYGEVVVVDIEKRSPAAAQDGLMLGLQLVAINSYEVQTGAQNLLQQLQVEMQRSLGKPTTFTFLDPLMVIREYTRTVDIQTNKNVFTLSLTPAAVNDYARFVDEVNELFTAVEPVSHIRLEMHQQHSVTFAFYSMNGEPFRLLWGTGPTHGESVRYNLGFSAQDTPMQSRHEGAPASIDINLELTDGQLDILIAELFRLPNGDMREELEFDEFRDLYVKYFDLSESIQSLKEWAQWKFKFAALEDEVRRQKLEQRLRRERMVKRREKNAAIYRAQKEFRMQKMFGTDDLFLLLQMCGCQRFNCGVARRCSWIGRREADPASLSRAANVERFTQRASLDGQPCARIRLERQRPIGHVRLGKSVLG
jgi:hypothetical protein